jgi:hypothetical protein
MIQSRYISGAKIPEYDVHINAFLKPDFDGGGSDTVIAVENRDRVVYRVITTTGLGEFMSTINAIWDIGLIDVLRDAVVERDGYDARFVVSQAMIPRARTDPASEVIAAQASVAELIVRERDALILARVGQGKFRDDVIAHWKVCAVTGAECVPLLKASHIKPWRDAKNEEHRRSLRRGPHHLR